MTPKYKKTKINQLFYKICEFIKNFNEEFDKAILLQDIHIKERSKHGPCPLNY